MYTQALVRSDKFKTGKEKFLQKEVKSEDNRSIIIGRIPVMVKSDLCWMNKVEKGDCDFDHGGYFIIKGAEKVSQKFGLIYLAYVWFFPLMFATLCSLGCLCDS